MSMTSMNESYARVVETPEAKSLRMEKQQQFANRAARREIANNALALLEAEN